MVLQLQCNWSIGIAKLVTCLLSSRLISLRLAGGLTHLMQVFTILVTTGVSLFLLSDRAVLYLHTGLWSQSGRWAFDQYCLLSLEEVQLGGIFLWFLSGSSACSGLSWSRPCFRSPAARAELTVTYSSRAVKALSPWWSLLQPEPFGPSLSSRASWIPTALNPLGVSAPIQNENILFIIHTSLPVSSKPSSGTVYSIESPCWKSFSKVFFQRIS